MLIRIPNLKGEVRLWAEVEVRMDLSVSTSPLNVSPDEVYVCCVSH